jgi:hypothetical protein
MTVRSRITGRPPVTPLDPEAGDHDDEIAAIVDTEVGDVIAVLHLSTSKKTTKKEKAA